MRGKSRTLNVQTAFQYNAPLKRERDEAIARFFTENHRTLIGYALRYTKNEHDALDLVQHAALKVLSGRNRCINKTKFLALIKKIIRNKFIDDYRRKTSYPVDLVDTTEPYNAITKQHALTQSFAQKLPTNCDDSIKAQQRKALDFIDDLPDNYREPLELFYLEGLTYKQIADILHISVKNARVRAFRGKNRIKKLYKQYYGDPESRFSSYER